jgi:capsule assembly protein Wzi
MTKKLLNGFLLLAIIACPTHTFAKGVSPYLPINVSPLVENEVNRLATVAGISNLTRPYSLATIFENMEKIKDSHPRLYSRLKTSLAPYTKSVSVTQFSTSIKASQDNHSVANQRGTTTNSNLNISFRTQWQADDWLGLYFGGDLTHYKESHLENQIQPTGSLIALGTDWAQIDIGYKDIWLSPFQGSAQLLSTHAETLPSVSVSNNRQLDTFGIQWNYNAFLAQTSRQLVQFRPGEFSDKDKPLIAGLHFSVQPTDWWSIGASRVFQFAGGDRPVSFGTLARAFFDPRGADNDASVDEESGNQIAAISSKINFDGEIPFSFTLELGGEDTSNNKAYQLGNTSLTAGLYFPYFFSERLSFNYEYSDWQTGWYNNNVYSEGYVNEGNVLGHWAMQPQRSLNTATPGSSHFLETFWQLENDSVLSIEFKTSEIESNANVIYQDAWELKLDYSIPWKGHVLTIGTYLGEDNFGERFSQVKLRWEL